MEDYERSDFRPRRSFAPVKVGEELDVNIEAVGEKGDGIAKKDGFVLFIPNTKEGENVRVKVTRVLKKVGFAEVVGEGSAKPSEDAPQEEAQQEQSEGGKESNEGDADEADSGAENTEDFGEDLDEEKQ